MEAEASQANKKKLTADVLSLVSHSDRMFAGVLLLKQNTWLIQPDNSRFQTPFSVDASPLFKVGNKVLFKIKEFSRNKHYPTAQIAEVLGKPGEHKTEMHAILAEFGLPEAFNAEVQEASDSVTEEITANDLKGREDFRKVLTFTIDPDTAKDFDDAISYRKLENGNYEIGVHIADVSHYVLPDSVLDKEALNRATSVYLVDRVVPMLPFNMA